MLKLSDHIRGPPLDLLQQLSVLVLEAPELNTVLQVGSLESSVEEKYHLTCPARHDTLDAALDLDTVTSQIFLLTAAFNPFSAQTVFMLGIALTQVQDFALGLVKLNVIIK